MSDPRTEKPPAPAREPDRPQKSEQPREPPRERPPPMRDTPASPDANPIDPRVFLSRRGDLVQDAC